MDNAPIWTHPLCRLDVRPFVGSRHSHITAGYSVELYGPPEANAGALAVVATVEARAAGRTPRQARRLAWRIARKPGLLKRLRARGVAGVSDWGRCDRRYAEIDLEIRWLLYGYPRELERRRQEAIAAGRASVEMPVDRPATFV